MGVSGVGIPGPAGPSPFLLTGLSGGTNNRLVYLLPDGVTCRDAHVSFLDALGFAGLLWKDGAGNYWQQGATITEAAGGLTPRNVRVMQPQTGASSPNWRDIDPKVAQPADLAATGNQNYVEFGKILSPTQWRFIEPQIDGGALSPVSRYDSFLAANYPRNAVIPASRVRLDRWNAFQSSYVYANTVGVSYPHGVTIELQGGNTAADRLASDETVGSYVDGQYRVLMTKGSGDEGGAVMRAQGTPAAPTGLILAVNTTFSVDNARLIAQVAGVKTVVAKLSLPWSNIPTQYKIEAEGTFLGGKFWDATQAEPAEWMLYGYQSLVTGAGYAGAYITAGQSGIGSLASVVNNGAQAALTGAT